MLPQEHFALPHLAGPVVPPAQTIPTRPWGLESGGGPLQGPLDLGFFHDQTFCLDLGPKQVALLTGEGRLSRLFPEGRHLLSIGDGSGRIDPCMQLILMDTGIPIEFEWTRSDPIRLTGDEPCSLLGRTALIIDDPEAFFTTFLAGHSCLEPAFVFRLLGQTVHAGLPPALDRVLPDEVRRNFSKLQAALLAVGSEILAAQLSPCGLRCMSLSLYVPSAAGMHREPVADIAGLCPAH